MITENAEYAAVELLLRALEPWEGVKVREMPREDRRSDLEVELDGGRYRLQLRPWGKREEGLRTPTKRSHIPVWIIRRGTPDFHERLRNASENFVDLTGTVRLTLPGLFLDRCDLEPPRAASRGETRNPFSDRASRIPRILFQSFPRDWSIQELAREGDVSLGLASYVVKDLSNRELLEIETQGREKRARLVSPESLILQWTAEYSWRRNALLAFSAPLGDPSRFLKRLPKTLPAEPWALTLQAGASLVAPHAVWDAVHIYVGVSSLEELRRAGSDCGWKADDRGRVVLMKPYYRHSFLFGSRKRDSLPVVSDLQLILDLWHYPNRGREQAEHLLDLHAFGNER